MGSSKVEILTFLGRKIGMGFFFFLAYSAPQKW